MKTVKLILVMILMAGVVPALALVDDNPRQIHHTWQRDDTAHTMAVSWKTSSDVGGVVYYDTVSGDATPSGYSFSVEAVSHSSDDINGVYVDAELTGLAPDTVYYYICGSQETGFSEERSFKTLSMVRDHLRIVAGGDSRTNPELRDLVSSMMAQYGPDFVLYNGDFVNNGNDDAQWDDFFDQAESLWVTPEGYGIPIVPAIGNHDGGSSNYDERLALPGNEEWYSLNFGSDIHLVVLNSESTVEGFGLQTEWLRADLESHKEYPWKFVLFHRNVLKNDHDIWLTGVNRWIPILDEYVVDIIFSGHSHNYQRSVPVNWTRSRTEAQASYDEGSMYLTSGAWGAPLYETVDGWWVASTDSRLHFTLIDMYANGTLKLQAIDETGEVFDKVALHKDLPDENTVLAERLVKIRQETDALNQENDALTQSVAELVLENEATLQAQDLRIDELVDQVSDLEIDLEIEQALITSYQTKVDELEAQLNVPVEPPSPLSHVLFLFFGLVVGGAISQLMSKSW